MDIRDIVGLAPVIPVLTVNELEHAVPLARALAAGGLRVLEVTMRTPVALAAIAATVAALFVPGRLRPPASMTEATMPHAELGMVAGGTLVGDESE